MSVTETLQGLGSWGMQFSGVPQHILDQIDYFGHVVVHTGRVDYRVEGDAALTSGRYVGVVRSKEDDNDQLTLSGASVALWLGDEDQKGSVLETLVTIAPGTTFENALRAVLPSSGSVLEGTFYNIGETFSGGFQFQSPREAIDYITSTVGAVWRVRGNGLLDAGLETDLFVTNPRTILNRRESGVDMAMRSFLGSMKTDQDVEDFTSRVVLLAQGEGAAVVTATADIDPGLNPYKDLFGNTIKMTRLVSESSTDSTNAPARAQLQLNRFSGTRDAITLSANEYDIKGDIAIGDYMWIHDPEMGLVDGANEVMFRGKRLNPIKLQLTEMTWPVGGKMSVGYRDYDGNWFNLTDYLVGESADTTLVVGGYNRSLTNADGGTAGSRPQPDTSVPGIPTWVEPFIYGVYQSPINGDTRAQVQLAWTRPNNVDGSTINDGDHWEIRYRQGSTPLFPVTWAQLAGKTWQNLIDDGATWDQPLQYVPGPWQFAYVPWSELNALIQELLPNMPYDAQIRAVDGAVPSNYGDWSDVAVFQTSADTIPPATPAPPECAASRIAVQITHRLGQAAGGEYNLDSDLQHLEIHGEYEPNFTPSDSTLLGKLLATSALITAHLPVVGTFNIESTMPTYFKVIAVDRDGNQSAPSAAAQQTALLIDDAHISDLTVSKVTAGTIQADWLVGGSIKTRPDPPLIELTGSNFTSYDANGNSTFHINALNGAVEMVGRLRTGDSSNRIDINPNANGLPRIDFYDNDAITTRHTTLVQGGDNFYMQREDDVTRIIRGGFLNWGEGYAKMGYAAGSIDSFMFITDPGQVYISANGAAEFYLGTDGFWQPAGLFINGNPMSGLALLQASFNDTLYTGPISISVGYGATMANVCRPIVNVYAGTADRYWLVGTPTSTGFVVKIGSGTGNQYAWMAFRTN